MTFSEYIGIDYSGAQTPTQSLPGLRVFAAEANAEPVEVPPPISPRRYWTRQGIAHWLFDKLSGPDRILVGIDHGFSFPKRYFEQHGIALEWDAFLDDFSRHWPTDEEHMYVDFIRDGHKGDGLARMGNSRWRRITEERCRAKSVFHFDVPGSVAKSTFAGIPWLRFLRAKLRGRIHFWPFDGFDVPDDRSVIAEVYPALWNADIPLDGRSGDQRDAYAIALALRDADASGRLAELVRPADVSRRASGGAV